MSSVTLQQLLVDARRLSTRLRERETAADGVITSSQGVLKNIEAMQEYQEEVEQLNDVAHNRPRAQLVIGIQQENRHIRQLQNENKELRAALEESQNAIELIMSKYRQHMSYLVNTTKLDKNLINQQKAMLLQERTDQIWEMAGIMQKSIEIDEDRDRREQELQTRLVTENQGLREMLEISRNNGSIREPIVAPKVVSRECQTDDCLLFDLLDHRHASVSSNASSSSLAATAKGVSTTSSSSSVATLSGGGGSHIGAASSATSPHRPPSSSSYTSSSSSPTSVIMASLGEEDNRSLNGGRDQQLSSESEDDEVTFNTIKRGQGARLSKKLGAIRVSEKTDDEKDSDPGGGGGAVGGDETPTATKQNGLRSRSSDGQETSSSTSSTPESNSGTNGHKFNKSPLSEEVVQDGKIVVVNGDNGHSDDDGGGGGTSGLKRSTSGSEVAAGTVDQG